KSTIDEIPSIVNLAVGFTLGTWFSEAILLDGSLHRSQVFLLLLVGLIDIAGFRTLARMLMLRTTSPERVLLVGSTRECNRANKALVGDASGINATVVGRVSLDPDGGGTYNHGDLPDIRHAIAQAINSQQV